MRPIVHHPARIVNLAKPRPHSALLLLAVDPDAGLWLKLVVREEHPSVLCDELDGF